MKKSLLGILLVILGGLFLLSNLGLIPMGVGVLLSTYWPIVLIYLGIEHLVKVYLRGDDLLNPGTLYYVALMVGSGLIFLGNHLGWFGAPISFWNFFWPLNVIFMGIRLLFREKSPTIVVVMKDKKAKKVGPLDPSFNSYNGEIFESMEPPEPPEPPISQAPKTPPSPGNNFAFIGSYEQGKDPWVLEDQRTMVAIGDIHLDLTKAFVKDGVTTLDLTGKIGSIEIIIPAGLAIAVQAEVSLGDINILGEKHSGTPGVKYYRSDDYEDALKKINLRLSVKIGSILVKQVD